MDPRISNLIGGRPRRLVCLLDRSEWPHDGTPTGQRLAREALALHAAKVIEVLERQAGRALSIKELVVGISAEDRIDDRSEVERVADASAAANAKAQQTYAAPDNPLAYARDRGLLTRRGKETPQQFLDREIATTQAKLDAKAAAEADASDPRKAKRRAAAAAELRRVQYDPGITLRELREVEGLVTLADGDDAGAFRAAWSSWQGARAAALDNERGKLRDQIGVLESSINALGVDAFDDLPVVAPPKPEPPKERPIEVIQMYTKDFDKIR